MPGIGNEPVGGLAGWFRTHPSTDDRICAALDEQRYLPEKDYYIVNTSEFDRVKARLQSIDNAQKASDEEGVLDQKRPTLKRKTEEEGTDSDGSGGDDDSGKRSRPTLKRPDDPPSAP